MKKMNKLKVLFIGGTGIISVSISELAVQQGIDLYLLNRGNRSQFIPEGAKTISADIHDETEVCEKLRGMEFDVVVDFIAFKRADLERDYRLFKKNTRQFIFISSASVYQSPLSSPWITEGTPLSNPYWQYARDKIDCEEFLTEKYRDEGFPITIIRPSHTYSRSYVPLGIHGPKGFFSVLQRIRFGQKVIVHGDGLSLWTVTHGRDFAKAFTGIMGNAHAIGEAYHITSDESLTWNQIYGVIGAAFGTQPKIVHIPTDTLAKLHESFSGGLLGDKANTVLFDNTKIKKAVPGFAATIRFDQGVRESLEYIYSHEECQAEDPDFDSWTNMVIKEYEAAARSLPKLTDQESRN